MATNDDWLNLVIEEALEPDLPICDPHHHLGIKRRNVEETYLLDEILNDINSSGHNIVSTVFIETMAMYRVDGPELLKPVGEVEFVNGIAAMSASGHYGPCRVAAGIVGRADLRQEGAAAGETLDAQIAVGGGRFKGIRVGTCWHAAPEIRNYRDNPPVDLFADATFREGMAELDKRGLSFETWCYHPQLPYATDLARAFPGTTFILNHLGGPLRIGPYRGKEDEVFADWQEKMAELATCGNVYVKLGGLQMDINGFDWHERPKPPTSEELAEATRPFHEYAIETFGVDRCMFESNFPVDKLMASYGVLWNSFKRVAAGCSDAEKAALFHDSAATAYRL
jgi:L-fuconolactonase